MQTASLQSLQRGLAVLELYNRQNGAKISDIVKILGLPRGTAYRLIETLRRSGYLVKGNARGQYWLAAQVTSLDSEYKREKWIIRVLTPLLEQLSEDVLWSVSLEMIQDQQLMIKAVVHPLSPLTNERYPVGARVALNGSAAGLLHVANYESGSSETIRIEVGRNSMSKGDRVAIRRRGYAIYIRAEPAMSELAVPIYVQQNLIATLTARYIPSVLSDRHGAKRLADRLRIAAQEIAAIIPSHVVAAVSSQQHKIVPITPPNTMKHGRPPKHR